MVKLLESRQKVMMLEKMMLGEKWNGVGQLGLDVREGIVYLSVVDPFLLQA